MLQSDEFLYYLLESEKDTRDLAMGLLDSGAPCNGKFTKRGANTVFWAVKRQKGPELLRRLLEGGTSPNTISRLGRTKQCPLLEAIKFKDRDSRRTYVKLLMDYGADISLAVDRKPLYMHMTETWLRHQTESVADILFSPYALQRVSKTRQIKYMRAFCQLPLIRLLRVLLESSSVDIVWEFAARYADSLPIWILDVKTYPRETHLTIEHIDLAITILGLLIQHGPNWDSRSLGYKRRAIKALKSLIDVTPYTAKDSLGASWCMRRRIRIIGADSGNPKFQLSAPVYSTDFPPETTLRNLGWRLRKTNSRLQSASEPECY
ncbi:hypothetical protein F4781DRAFT_345020 [Annulohypoxylon bovei var. microspora]|nr:hypothetical protein F4781DRAFT_345020 [Annulohypoxylon bovei var. microspora]